ncbi:tRNA lysidine(34) synthetase TilS [Xanthomonas translucens]|uniref:tRNA(Ile)-lysidine synthase n=9 Tax=Xanthomonas campestris pv. translucens TaxID=343 RepID=A0A1C3TQA3_XANCT|nr:tRNA lysidine(34) synthetase TilS [Xanthomonas translucens]QSQ32044.1 tRNA lysidine(34) synthetase TilS [Xanthomonas translucens pv. translucens]QSQ46967.1 tRNA lysidine(34) synthetase TilS [Xanthomonas translucens pv. translucens]SCB05397.1 Putative cell cycle protein mesJ homolog [Xanthomonas translucens pv. translucens DSM 18974]
MKPHSDIASSCAVSAALPDPAPAAVLVALSGGLDSSVLLHALAHQPHYRRAGLRALHVHHGLHADADAWADHCAGFCAALAIPLQVLRVQVPRDSGHGLEAAARQARRAAFAQVLGEGEWLALAQHRDDQAETFLLRALRASGPDGLAAMQGLRSFAQGMLWRPLLALPRSALHAYAQRHALHWIEDPSNADPGFDRNFLRLQVVPLLRQRWPHADAALARSAQLCGEAGALLEDGDQAALEALREHATAPLSLPPLRALPAPRRARVLRRWVAQAGLPPLPAAGLLAIERTLLHARADAAAQFAWHGATLRGWRDALYAERDPPPLPADWQAQWDGRAPLALPDGRRLRLLADAPLVFDAPLLVRLRQGGERVLLPGRVHSQALKQVLQEAAVPPWQRARLPLLFDAERLLAAGADIVAAPLHAWLQARNARLALDAAATPSSPASH